MPIVIRVDTIDMTAHLAFGQDIHRKATSLDLSAE